MIRKTLLAMLGGVERERYDSAMKRGDFWRSAYDEELSAKCRALDACDRAEAEARDADEALRTTLEHGAVTDDILALATALGMREGKNTANGIAKHALEEYRRVVQERDEAREELDKALSSMSAWRSDLLKVAAACGIEEHEYPLKAALRVVQERDALRADVERLTRERDEARAGHDLTDALDALERAYAEKEEK
jgi:hypothetical protein